MPVRISKAAGQRLDDIWEYTRERWGVNQADRYIDVLYAAFDRIEQGKGPARPIGAEFGVKGHWSRVGRHIIYWSRLADGDVGIYTILHDRMHQITQFRVDAAD